MAVPSFRFNDSSNCCSHCQNSAYEFCCCSFPLVWVCPTCKSVHQSKSQGFHCYFKTSESSKVSSTQHIVTLKHLLVNLEEGTNLFKESIARVRECQEQIRINSEAWVSTIKETAEQQVQELECLKQAMETAVLDTATRVKDELLNEFPSGNYEGYFSTLWQYTHSNEQEKAVCKSYFQFQYSCTGLQISPDELLGVEWEGPWYDGVQCFWKQNNTLNRKLSYNQLFEDVPRLQFALEQYKAGQDLSISMLRVALKYYESKVQCLHTRDEALKQFTFQITTAESSTLETQIKSDFQIRCAAVPAFISNEHYQELLEGIQRVKYITEQLKKHAQAAHLSPVAQDSSEDRSFALSLPVSYGKGRGSGRKNMILLKCMTCNKTYEKSANGCPFCHH